MNKLKVGSMNRYCLVCTPRSGSFYILNHLSYNMNLANGKECFGRMKKVHYDCPNANHNIVLFCIL